jgi:hypothetical protein
MNVGKLKRVLDAFEDDKPIFMSIDEEGNAFYHLHEVIMEPEVVMDGAQYPLVLWPGGMRVEEEYVD